MPKKMLSSKNPLWAGHFADAARAIDAPICENVRIARETYRIRLDCPDIARQIRPGQFVMLRLPARDDPLLARPFALYDIVVGPAGTPVGIDVVYLVVGAMTRRLANGVVGESIEVIGPLGNGFSLPEASHLVMVAGGIGQTPFLALAKEHLGIWRYGNANGACTPNTWNGNTARVADPDPCFSQRPTTTLCYGAKTSEYLAGVADFEALGVNVRISTDDGSAGHHGLVTELLEKVLTDRPEEGRGAGENCQVVACGPEPMMEAVARMAVESRVPCEVSLETPMACGLGICFSCVARVRQPDGGWDYKRTCVDGPVFDAEKIVW